MNISIFKAGVITEYTPHCHVTCKNPVKVEGQCCPSCGQCEIEGKIYKEGEIIPSNLEDPCIVCKCTQGNMICTKSSCPVLACPQSKWIKSKNECCPTCKGNFFKMNLIIYVINNIYQIKGHRKVKDFEENCIMGLSTYQNGQSYILDHCTECICNVIQLNFELIIEFVLNNFLCSNQQIYAREKFVLHLNVRQHFILVNQMNVVPDAKGHKRLVVHVNLQIRNIRYLINTIKII